MAKTRVVRRGASGTQAVVTVLVHPDMFNYDEKGEAVSVKCVEVPVESQVNNGSGFGFYLAKGFIDPLQFLKMSEYKDFAKKNKDAAESFEGWSLEKGDLEDRETRLTLRKRVEGVTGSDTSEGLVG